MSDSTLRRTVEELIGAIAQLTEGCTDTVRVAPTLQTVQAARAAAGRAQSVLLQQGAPGEVRRARPSSAPITGSRIITR